MRAGGRISTRAKAAQEALLAVAVQIVLVQGQDENLPLWGERLRALLRDIPVPDSGMKPVVEAVRTYLADMDRGAVSTAQWRLRVVLGRYYQRAAADRLATWGQAK